MNFESGSANKDRDGNRCDNCFLCQNACDPFIVVKIDGVEKYRSRTIWDSYTPTFDSTFNSEPISEDASITIELWDNDDGDSNDDLMSRWDNLRVSSLLSTRHLADRYNTIQVHSKWTYVY